MLNLSAPGVMSPNNDGAAQRKNSGPTHHGEYLDSNIVSMDIQKFDITDEEKFMDMISRKFNKKIYDSDPVYKMPIEPSTHYSDDPEI